MFDYMTVEETAEKWQVSTQCVQGLCRKGEIPGAIKKGVMWFVPKEAEHPDIKGDQILRFKGTKREIFVKAVRLFSEQSYEVVTLKDITDAVGIAQSAVYRHFKSKREVLDAVYAYFSHYQIADRPKMEALEHVIKNGSIYELFDSCNYQYQEGHRELMVSCLRIIFQRMSIDTRAGEIFRRVILEEGIAYVEQLFSRAMAEGKMPKCDAHVLSVYSNMSRLFVLLNWFVYPDLDQDEKKITCQQEILDLIVRGLAAPEHV